jgi:carboxypeptidase PM20D1
MMRAMRRALAAVALALLAFALLLVARAALLRPPRDDVPPAPRVALADEPAMLERLAAAIRIQTLSHQDPAQDDPAVFQAFREHLEASFPALHAALRRELVNGRSLLYTWPGRDPSLPGVVLMAHQDVVPVEPGTEGGWEQPPFSGAVADGFVWGRGTMDTKGKLLALCEAVELLAREGFQPQRTTYLAFGHDEEVGGREGALVIAQRFQREGARFAWVLDEGGTIGTGIVPGVAAPVALIGISEKGYATLALTATAAGGHSSMPPPQTAIGILAEAVRRLESHPLPAGLRGATRHFLASVAPSMRFPLRVVVANQDLLEPLVLRALAGSPRGNAAIRTTTAVTMIQGGVKENALPASARAIANFRLLPGDTVESVLAFVRRVVDDPRVTVEVLAGSTALDPSTESRIDGDAFALLARTIRASYPGVVIAPNLVLGGTDARYFHPLSDSVYRFGPLHVEPEDLKRPHGTNERIGVADYLDSVRFYVQLLRNAG